MNYADLLRQTTLAAISAKNSAEVYETIQRDKTIADEFIKKTIKSCGDLANEGKREFITEVPAWTIGVNDEPCGALKLIVEWARVQGFMTKIFTRRIAPLVEDFFIRFSW